jgi:hypothetical protein
VKISLAGAPPPDLRVKIDNAEVKFDDFNHAEVDPGHHVLDAGANGYKSVHQEFDVTGRGGQMLDIQLVQGDNSVIIDRGAKRRKIAIITGVSGGALIAGSLGVAYLAKIKYDSCFDTSPMKVFTPTKCAPTDREARDYANKWWWVARYVATPMFGAGVIAVGVGTYLYLSAPQRERIDRTVFVPTIAPDQLGFSAVGHF